MDELAYKIRQGASRGGRADRARWQFPSLPSCVREGAVRVAQRAFGVAAGGADYREVEGGVMSDAAAARGELIRYLENALAIADELDDGQTGYLIERALDQARSRQFMPASKDKPSG
jgi:hypothetical protein